MKDQARDRRLVSNEPHEIEYIHRQYFPNKTHQDVATAIAQAKEELGSNDREQIMKLLRQKLS
jgi:uncharacterized protein YqeY